MRMLNFTEKELQDISTCRKGSFYTARQLKWPGWDQADAGRSSGVPRQMSRQPPPPLG